MKERNLYMKLQRIAKEMDEESTDTYSSMMRHLNKEAPEEAEKFRKAFKDAFDAALDEEPDDHREIALLQAKKVVSSNESDRLISLAQAYVSSAKSPEEVASALANVISMLLKRVPHANAIQNIKNKISQINPTEIATTSMPDTAAYGQSLTLVKTLLNGYSPTYVQQVLTAVVRRL